MAYPNLDGFKFRALAEASTTTTGSPTCSVVVPFRGKYLYSIAQPLNLVSQTAATGSIFFAVNGSTASIDPFVSNPAISVTTSTGNNSTGGFSSINNVTAALYLNQGDSISVTGSSIVPFAITHIIQEF